MYPIDNGYVCNGRSMRIQKQDRTIEERERRRKKERRKKREERERERERELVCKQKTEKINGDDR